MESAINTCINVNCLCQIPLGFGHSLDLAWTRNSLYSSRVWIVESSIGACIRVDCLCQTFLGSDPSWTLLEREMLFSLYFTSSYCGSAINVCITVGCPIRFWSFHGSCVNTRCFSHYSWRVHIMELVIDGCIMVDCLRQTPLGFGSSLDPIRVWPLSGPH